MPTHTPNSQGPRPNVYYTEDKVVIFNVFVSKLPKNIQMCALNEYFSQFGPTREIILKPIESPKYAQINYVNPEDARKCLLKREHHINGHLLRVTPADSRLQPGPEYDPAASVTQTDNYQYNCDCLENLAEDVLELFYRRLSLRSRVNLSMALPKFSQIFERLASEEYTTLTLTSLTGMTCCEIREFFIRVGPYIDRIIGVLPESINGNRVCEFISQYCTNVTCVKITVLPMKTCTMQGLLYGLTCLTELNLRACRLRDNNIKIISKVCSQLRKLAVPNNFYLTGRYMEMLSNLRELDVHQCPTVQGSYLMEVARSLTELRNLDIRGTSPLGNGEFGLIAKYLTKLETLKISDGIDYYESLCLLKNLTSFEFSNRLPDASIPGELFDALVMYMADQLVELNLRVENCVALEQAEKISKLTKLEYFVCAENEQLDDECLELFAKLTEVEEICLEDSSNITGDGLCALLEHCTKLERMDIRHCEKITDIFVIEAIRVLEKQERSQPIEIYVSKSEIPPSFLKDALYLASRHLLKLSYDSPKFCDCC